MHPYPPQPSLSAAAAYAPPLSPQQPRRIPAAASRSRVPQPPAAPQFQQPRHPADAAAAGLSAAICAAAAIPAAFAPQPPPIPIRAAAAAGLPCLAASRAYDPYGRPQQCVALSCYPTTAAGAVRHTRRPPSRLCSSRSAACGASPRDAPIEEIRDSLREFRDAIRDLTESRARRRYSELHCNRRRFRVYGIGRRNDGIAPPFFVRMPRRIRSRRN